MAFLSPYTNSRGRTFPSAYLKVQVAQCSMQSCHVIFAVWEDQASRQSHPLVPDSTFDKTYETVAEMAASNPLDYAYQLADASGEWPDATWNV